MTYATPGELMYLPGIVFAQELHLRWVPWNMIPHNPHQPNRFHGTASAVPQCAGTVGSVEELCVGNKTNAFEIHLKCLMQTAGWNEDGNQTNSAILQSVRQMCFSQDGNQINKCFRHAKALVEIPLKCLNQTGDSAELQNPGGWESNKQMFFL